MDQPRISTHYLHWLHDYVRSKGGDTAVLGPLPSYEQQPFIPMLTWRTRLDQAAACLGDPDLGVHFGETIAPHRFGMLGYLLHHGENFGHVLSRAWRFRMLFFRLREMRPEGLGSEARISWRLDDAAPHFQEETFAIVASVQFARVITGQALQAHAVGLMNAEPDGFDVLARFLGCPIHFSQEASWIRADLSVVALPTSQPDAALSAVLGKQVTAMLAALPNDDPLISAVRRHIMALLPEGEPTQERVAQRMYMSTRTLHRQLAQQNHCFRNLLSETRLQVAKNYLLDSRYGLSEIALLLGYGQQSSFNHAFKSWAGVTPSAWRQTSRA